MDFHLFDHLFDFVFVTDCQGRVIYANESGANWLQQSTKRLSSGRKKINDLINLGSNQNLLDVSNLTTNEEAGWIETHFEVTTEEIHEGVIQINRVCYPIGDNDLNWIFFFHDVSLEERLHRKYQDELKEKEEAFKSLEKANKLLESYSQDLEIKVKERTIDLSEANRLLETIMNSLGQGFLVFDKSGYCLDFYTRVCERIVECIPAGKHITQVLKVVESADLKSFENWLTATFSQALSFDLMKDLAPNKFQHSEGLFVELDYFPIFLEGQLDKVVCVATDKTAEENFRSQLANQEALVAGVMKIIEFRDLLGPFLKRIRGELKNMSLIEIGNEDSHLQLDLKRNLHTLEGEAGLLGLQHLVSRLKAVQDLIDSDYVCDRTDWISGIDGCLNALEQFENDNREILAALKIKDGDSLKEGKEISEFSTYLINKNVKSEILGEFNRLFVWQNLSQYLSRYKVMVDDLAKKLNRKIAPLDVSGDDPRVDPQIWDPIIAQLVHLFRNALDHGVETPEERSLCGKPELARLSIKVEKLKDYVRLIVSDDGRGIDPEALRNKLQQKYPGEDFASLKDNELIQNIFRPQFSSRQEVSEFSGRGVGLDSIYEMVIKCGGKIEVRSIKGMGTDFLLTLPIEKFDDESVGDRAA